MIQILNKIPQKRGIFNEKCKVYYKQPFSLHYAKYDV